MGPHRNRGMHVTLAAVSAITVGEVHKEGVFYQRRPGATFVIILKFFSKIYPAPLVIEQVECIWTHCNLGRGCCRRGIAVVHLRKEFASCHNM